MLRATRHLLPPFATFCHLPPPCLHRRRRAPWRLAEVNVDQRERCWRAQKISLVGAAKQRASESLLQQHQIQRKSQDSESEESRSGSKGDINELTGNRGYNNENESKTCVGSIKRTPDGDGWVDGQGNLGNRRGGSVGTCDSSLRKRLS